MQRNVFARAAATALSKGYPAGPIQLRMHFHDPGFVVQLTLYQSCDLSDSTRWHGAAQRICEGGSDGAVKAQTAGRIQLWMHMYVPGYRSRAHAVSVLHVWQTAQGGIVQRNVFARAAVTALSKREQQGAIQLWMHLYVLDSRYSSRCISLARCQTAQGGILQRNKFARAAVTALSKGYPAGTIQHIMHFHDLDLR